MINKINDLITQAYLQDNKPALKAYKYLKTLLINNTKSKTPQDEQTIFAGLIKRYKDAITSFENAKAYTLVAQETDELRILESLYNATYAYENPREVESYVYGLIKEHNATIKDTKMITELARKRYVSVTGAMVAHLIKSL